MGLLKWTNEKTKNLDLWDIAALKLYCTIFGIVVGAYISTFVKQYLFVFIVLFALLGIKLVYKMFKK